MVACSNNQNMLVGKWKLVNTSSPQRMNKSLEKGLMWEFCEDNTYTSSSFEGVNSQGGWRAEGSILYMTDAGIADKDKPFIFDRFFCADKSRTQKEHYGLGLCIAKELVEMHKGKIELSDTLGGGCTFKISLPF